MNFKDFIIITGLSGSGKSSALKNLEDLHYFCIDNLPPALMAKFAQLAESSGFEKVAVAVDDSGKTFTQDLQDAVKLLPDSNFKAQIVFFDAPDEVLVRRFSESHHRHPLASREGRITEAIRKERCRLEEIRGLSDRIIDTGEMTPAKLKEEITRLFFDWQKGARPISIIVISFGFKYGVPRDVDLLFDARILPNPHYDRDIRHLDGTSPLISKYVFSTPEAEIFMEKIIDLLKFMLPMYVQAGKSHLTIGVGCTGGHHRSVAAAGRINGFLLSENYIVSQDHRDLEKQKKHYRSGEDLC